MSLLYISRLYCISTIWATSKAVEAVEEAVSGDEAGTRLRSRFWHDDDVRGCDYRHQLAAPRRPDTWRPSGWRWWSSVWSDLSPGDGAARGRDQGYLYIFTASKTTVQQPLTQQYFMHQWLFHIHLTFQQKCRAKIPSIKILVWTMEYGIYSN